MITKGFSFILICIVFLNGLWAQTTQKEQPLTQVLDALTKQYDVSFSYADQVLTNISIVPPDTRLQLRAVITYLETKTHLKFQFINKRFISIVKQKAPNVIREQLDEVVIKNYLTTGITKLNDGSLTIKPDKFGILPGLIEPDILQTIQALPGVYSVEESVSNINVRGGTHDQNLILWDGIKMYQSGHFFGLISAFNPFTTQKINVYKNGTRAKYGDGVSSVIDMQLTNTIEGKYKGGAGFNLINAHAHATIPITHNLELQLSTRRSLNDFVLTPTYDQYFKRVFQDSDLSNTLQNDNSISQNESFLFHDITAKLLYDLTKTDKLRLHFFNVTNRLNYEERAVVDNRSEALNSNLSQQNLAYSITHNRTWHKNLETSAQVYVTHYNLEATNFDIINAQRLIQRNQVVDGTAKLDINYSINTNFKLNAGYQFSEVGISNLQDVNNPIFRSFIREVVRTHSVYTESAFLSNSAKTRLNLGLRLNTFNKLGAALVEPRLNFSQRFFNRFRLEILGEFKHQTTSQTVDLQNDFLGIENRRWVLANTNTETINANGKLIFPVPILKSQQASAGLHYNNKHLLISAEAFIKKVDGITTRSQSFQNQFQFTNATGSYTINGVDVLINNQFASGFSASAGYTFSTNNYTFPTLNEGQAFPNNADVRHALSLASAYTNQRIKVSLGLNWHTGRPTTLPTFNQTDTDTTINYEAPNAENLKDYLRADLSATYNLHIFDNAKTVLGASVWNILNTNNILNTYHTLNTNNRINTINIESLGITPNISFRVAF